MGLNLAGPKGRSRDSLPWPPVPLKTQSISVASYRKSGKELDSCSKVLRAGFVLLQSSCQGQLRAFACEGRLGHGDAPCPYHFENSEGAQFLKQFADHLFAAYGFDNQSGLRGFDDLSAEFSCNLAQRRFGLRRYRNLDQCQIAEDTRVSRIFNPQNVHELIKVRLDTMGGVLVTFDHDSHARDAGLLGGADGERVE